MKFEKAAMASAEKSNSEVVSVELPAPEGWRKKFTPKQGATPKRNEIVFISPTGEEIKNRRQLDQYLRSHSGGPPSSEFDWGTGDTPRRSARISGKAKTPEAEKPKRDSRSSSVSQKGTKRKKNTDEDDDEHKAGGEESSLKKGAKRKKITDDDDGHKAEGEACAAAEGDGPKDMVMEETEGTEHAESKEEASNEGIHGLIVEEDTADKTKENVEENVEQQPVGSQGAIKHELADKAMKNNDEKVEQDVEKMTEGKEAALEPENDGKENQNGAEISPPASDSEKVVLIEKGDEVSDSKKDEASVCKKDAEALSENGSEKKDEQLNVAPKDNLEPEKEVSPAASDSKNVALFEKDDDISAPEKDEASIYLNDGEILPGNDEEVNAEPGKEVEENQNDTEKVSLTEKDDEVSAAEKDEAPPVIVKGAGILSENGGKKDEAENATTPEGNFLHDYDDGKMQSDSFPANW